MWSQELLQLERGHEAGRRRPALVRGWSASDHVRPRPGLRMASLPGDHMTASPAKAARHAPDQETAMALGIRTAAYAPKRDTSARRDEPHTTPGPLGGKPGPGKISPGNRMALRGPALHRTRVHGTHLHGAADRPVPSGPGPTTSRPREARFRWQIGLQRSTPIGRGGDLVPRGPRCTRRWAPRDGVRAEAGPGRSRFS